MSKLSATIGEIYEAAINPNHWDVALTSIVSHCELPHWDVAFLLWEKQTPPFGRFLGASGVAEYVRDGYVNFFAGRNPWSERALNLPLGQVVHSDELIPRNDFKKTALYKNFLKMWKLETAIISTIDYDGDAKLGLVIPGPDNGSINHMIEVLKLLCPHIQRACRISRKIGEIDLRAQSAMSLLNQTRNAVILLSDNFEVFFSNPNAEKLFETGYFDVKNKLLRINCRNSDLKIKSFVTQSETHSIALNIAPPDLAQKRGLLLKLDKYNAKTLTGDLFGASYVLIINEEASNDVESGLENLRQWFGFTPAESRLALALRSGFSLEQYALERGVSINAARFLLRGLYHKTATNKQGRLIKVLNDCPNGFVC